MRYQHRFRVHAALPAVAAFHRDPESMRAITPPPAIVRLHRVPKRLDEGDGMAFTLWLGPLPLRWRARIEDVSPEGFVDRQLEGPFQSWVHRHTFVPVDEKTTDVVDEVEATLSHNPLWVMIGLGMWLSLPFLFAYRGWKTRRLLEDS